MAHEWRELALDWPKLSSFATRGQAYAQALRDAGVDVTELFARGHVHTSLHAVDVVLSGVPLRQELAEFLTS